jgi:beta-carotene 3-hydroxylase
MLFFIILLLAFITMEGVAWAAHKYIMHGFLWHLHQDHHTKNPNSFFEKNDYFFVLFAIPGILFIFLGTLFNMPYALAIGLGITLYGFIYFLIHEIFIHQRFKFLKITNKKYLKAIRRAHKIHHKHTHKEHGECFGMLWIPLKYFKNL